MMYFESQASHLHTASFSVKKGRQGGLYALLPYRVVFSKPILKKTDFFMPIERKKLEFFSQSFNLCMLEVFIH